MKKILLLFTAMLVFSCSSDNDDKIENNTVNYPVVGKWRLLSERVGATQEEMTDVTLVGCEFQHTLQFNSDSTVVIRHFGGEGCMTMNEAISQWFTIDGSIYNFPAEHDADGVVKVSFSDDFGQMTIDAYDGENYYSCTYVNIP